MVQYCIDKNFYIPLDQSEQQKRYAGLTYWIR